MSNRECAFCFGESSCNPVGEYYDQERGCPGVIDPWRPCAPCSNKPSNHSVYVAPMDTGSAADAYATLQQCTWMCEFGYYARAGESDVAECLPCTPMSSENCRPGFVRTFCSSYSNTDAACSQPCNRWDASQPYAKPDDGDETSEWIWTVYNSTSGEIMPNPTGGLDGLPNAGCMWACKQGYSMRVVHAGSGKPLAFCVPAS